MRCGGLLYVSEAYARTFVIISAIVGFILVWIVGVRDVVDFCLFWIPTAYSVLTVVARVAPFVWPPVLIAQRSSHITTLGLDTENDHHDE